MNGDGINYYIFVISFFYELPSTLYASKTRESQTNDLTVSDQMYGAFSSNTKANSLSLLNCSNKL